MCLLSNFFPVLCSFSLKVFSLRVFAGKFLAIFYRVRREKDKNKPLMTLILQQLSPSHQSRSAENDVVIAADKNSKRVLHYQKFSEISKTIHFPLVNFCFVALY